MIEDLLSQLKVLVSSIRKNKAVNINSREIREAAISIGSFFFKNCRSDAQRILGDDKKLLDLDEQWQQLIRLAHGNNPKKYYLSLLSQLLKKTTDLAVASHASDLMLH